MDEAIERETLEALEFQYLYRAVGFLKNARAYLEKVFFLRVRDLFSQKLDLLFLDTTSNYVFTQSAEILKILAENTENCFLYVLGCKLFKNKEVREQSSRAGPLPASG